jgi:hypothetical protein
MLEKPKKERIKFTQYTINLAGDCFIDLEDILEALEERNKQEEKK